MKKYGKFAALVVIIVGTLLWLATAGIKENQTYYKTVAELGHMGDQAYVKRLRVAGDVGAGSIVSLARHFPRRRAGAGRWQDGSRWRLSCE
jgi:cytochrome c-type biogenesis protein CcmE